MEAREAYANDAVAEGRAARAAARALVEAEGRERRVADEDYAEQLRSLIEETKGQLQAAAEALVEQARRDANDKVEKEAGSRDALARGLRLEAEERQRALARRTGAASVIDDLVDRVADQAQMARDATQDDELAAWAGRAPGAGRGAIGPSRGRHSEAVHVVGGTDAVVHRIADKARRERALGEKSAWPRGEARDQASRRWPWNGMIGKGNSRTPNARAGLEAAAATGGSTTRSQQSFEESASGWTRT